MPIIQVEDHGDSRLALYRNLSDAELLQRHGVFVAEGRLVLQRVIADRRLQIRSILLNETNYRSLAMAIGIPADVPVFVCETSDFLGITGFNLHRGCLALVERPAPLATCEILRDARTLVVLEAVTNADNVGGVFRNVAAFAADGVMLSPTSCDPLYRKAIRTSMGASLQIPFARIDDWPGGLGDVRGTGFTIVALTPDSSTTPLDEFAAGRQPERLALLIGSEGDGLSEAAMAAADRRVRIPISDAVDSLNLAVASGIALARLSRTRFL